ncbi:glycosyltransferase family 25 protein [Shimia sp. CNT1-13L.2]|uniref:glycosyltransferase family 25 protein n=1 Tax=Shimia sp. CNT1-13L.2 TaxID=2959663 RepID=UPI0020CDDF6D|nr:glycosyltransferase family 25 protein [Shimia sp. CNT1-13L.2]MCP9480876.1 glycosyltransferase family 25 protein [Shimia sp. CNT1-13L.2]
MKIPGYFINLDRAEQRAAHMRSEAERLDLPLTRLPAVDGRQLDETEQAALHEPAIGMHRMSGPEIGCFLSHRAAWKQIAEGEYPFGAVFEDDLKFAEDSTQLLNDDSWLPEGAGVIKIETTSRKVLVEPPYAPVGPNRQLGRLGSLHLGAGGYILSRDFAATLIDRTEQFSVPVDYLLFDQTHGLSMDVDRWQLFPAICVQQVRSKDNFLPSGAEASGLDSARKVLKRKGLAKLRRELSRPFVDAAKEISARLHARRMGGKWIFIDYND